MKRFFKRRALDLAATLLGAVMLLTDAGIKLLPDRVIADYMALLILVELPLYQLGVVLMLSWVPFWLAASPRPVADVIRFLDRIRRDLAGDGGWMTLLFLGSAVAMFCLKIGFGWSSLMGSWLVIGALSDGLRMKLEKKWLIWSLVTAFAIGCTFSQLYGLGYLLFSLGTLLGFSKVILVFGTVIWFVSVTVLMNRAIDLMLRLARQPLLLLPAGSKLASMTQSMVSSEVYSSVLGPTVRDLQDEYNEACSRGRIWTACWVRWAGYWAFSRVLTALAVSWLLESLNRLLRLDL